jgi:hypothetical protein
MTPATVTVTAAEPPWLSENVTVAMPGVEVGEITKL